MKLNRTMTAILAGCMMLTALPAMHASAGDFARASVHDPSVVTLISSPSGSYRSSCQFPAMLSPLCYFPEAFFTNSEVTRLWNSESSGAEVMLFCSTRKSAVLLSVSAKEPSR